DVSAALGRAPVAGVIHPPGSHVDQATLWALHQNGIRLLLVDADTVHQASQPQGLAEPAVAELSIGTPTPLEAIVPDGGVQQLLDGESVQTDPRLAGQAVLGELCQIWLQAPSASRGVVLIVPEKMSVPGA